MAQMRRLYCGQPSLVALGLGSDRFLDEADNGVNRRQIILP